MSGEGKRVFVSGVMQGSLAEGIVAQGYRHRIAEVVRRYHPGVEVIDPLEHHPESVGYGLEEARRTLLEEVAWAGEVDLLIAYLPEASMGTALEMWSAYQAGKPVVTISPLERNWVVMVLSTHVLPTLEAFEEFVAEGGLRRWLG